MRIRRDPSRLVIASALALCMASASPAAAQEATFPKGQWSIGGQFGYALFSMSQINDLIAIENGVIGTHFEDLKDGWDYVGDLRYAVTNTYFIGVESGHLQGETTDEEVGRTYRASATPVVLIGGGSVVSDNSRLAIRLFGGLGALVDGTFEELGVEGSVSGTSFLFQLGGEFEYRIIDPIGVTAQAMVRQAKVTSAKSETPPETEAPYDIDFSGGSGRIGLRFYFGGGGEE